MSNLLTDDIIAALEPQTDNSLIITAGNSFRRDDGVGPFIAEKLKQAGLTNVIDAGHTPENIVDQVIELAPGNIVFIDAADFSGAPGQTKIIPEEHIAETTLSTHMIPLNVVSALIADSIKTTITFIGIQPADVSFGEGLTTEVQKTAGLIVLKLKKMFA
jgi:hydrogenase 3 maturation protease